MPLLAIGGRIDEGDIEDVGIFGERNAHRGERSKKPMPPAVSSDASRPGAVRGLLSQLNSFSSRV